MPNRKAGTKKNLQIQERRDGLNVSYVGEGRVELLAGGGKVYTDIAARFCRSERSLLEIVESEYDASLVRTIVNSNHGAALEFDWFLFGVEGYSRVCEVQLVRKRHASYLIKSGRVDKHGKRSFDMVIPHSITDHTVEFNGLTWGAYDIMELTEAWYNSGVEAGKPEEDLRYLKHQATEYKAIIGMNAHALIDWFKIRCCNNAQVEIRDMAYKMLGHASRVAPDLFMNAGPSCACTGWCPENRLQNKACKGKIPTQDEVKALVAEWRANK